MKIIIDTDSKKMQVEDEIIDLYSKRAFEIISDQWLKVGWNEKYEYNFTWFGRPIIQLPEDMIRIQELIYNIKPDIIVETGVAHGGSLIYYASICKAIGKGKIIGIDIDIREHNRSAIEAHELYPLINLIQGSSIDEDIFENVKKHIGKEDTVLVILDSCHTREHVYKELELYSQLVTKGSYIVVEDGVMKDLHDVPRGNKEWVYDNPSQAALDFIEIHSEFILEQPKWLFCESELDKNITHWPNAWIKKK